MDTYNGLRRICTVWVMLSIAVGFFAGLAGGLQVIKGDLFGAVYIIAAVIAVLFTQTLSEVVSLLIDMVIYLRRISELTGLEIERPQRPRNIQKLPKD